MRAAAGAWAVLLMLGASAAQGALECRYRADHAGGTLLRQAHVGEVDRRSLQALQRLVNEGPHDIRATFDGAAPRVLQRGQAEPQVGLFGHPVTLTSVECLPSRSASLPLRRPGPSSSQTI